MLSFFQVSPPKPCMHFFSPHVCYIPCPSHPNNIWWGAQIMTLLIMQFPPVSSFFHPLKVQISSSVFYFETTSVNVYPLSVKNQISYLYKTICKSHCYTVSSVWRDCIEAKWWQVYHEFTVSSQAIQVPVETAFWRSPVSPEYQQWCTQYIVHADKCWWLPGRHHHCQSGSALTHPSLRAQLSPVHSKPVHEKVK